MKPIFSRNSDYNKTAFLNWRIEKGSDILNLSNMAAGFLGASISLAKLCLKNNNQNKEADIFIFPILTNANHGIELYLKAINWILNILTGSARRIEGGHNIKQLLETIRTKIPVYKGGLSLKAFNSEIHNLDNYINELYLKIEATAKDNKMDFSRYSINKDYDNHFYVDYMGNVEIDLENFVLRFQIIKDKLEMISDFLYHYELTRVL